MGHITFRKTVPRRKNGRQDSFVPAHRINYKEIKTMRRNFFLLMFMLCLATSVQGTEDDKAKGFVTVLGENLMTPDGKKLFIQGANLGNWLNPEGYMFGFSRTNSAWMIDQMIKQAVGPDFAADFWRKFKDNYITRRDIAFIRSQGANTIRLPFNYKLFTEEDYMGQSHRHDGFALVDSVVTWCRDNGLYLILDTHDCPGSQTGDNIDDGYGYPWIFESEPSQQLFCDIWQRIAERYQNETVILGYELMNEPITHFFEDKEQLNRQFEPLYKRAVPSAVAAICRKQPLRKLQATDFLHSVDGTKELAVTVAKRGSN